ncbi:hypothetical protein Vretimale_14819 [Volvox reticuliferus]|uniref:Uncharacterized protein n=1 Tax=Volvox reticuliferus TaxID=1737510 RepID=A0A8J4D184_9CHLO|nr:hypothetical protein Vretifemale_19287 [Volvox reticuliferus]GIM11296.1 hypothetical protein Vretimale_14819 [Volvox reticuliferus]
MATSESADITVVMDIVGVDPRPNPPTTMPLANPQPPDHIGSALVANPRRRHADNADNAMREAATTSPYPLKRRKLPDPPSPGEWHDMSVNGAKKAALPVAVYHDYVLDDLFHRLYLSGRKDMDEEVSSWIIVHVGPPQLRIDLTKDVAALPNCTIPSMEWLRTWLRNYSSATDSPLILNAIRRLKAQKVCKSVDEVQQFIAELRHELPASTPEALLVYAAIDVLPSHIARNIMFNRDTGGVGREWDKWASFWLVLRSRAGEFKSVTPQEASADVASSSNGGPPSGLGNRDASFQQPAKRQKHYMPIDSRRGRKP